MGSCFAFASSLSFLSRVCCCVGFVVIMKQMADLSPLWAGWSGSGRKSTTRGMARSRACFVCLSCLVSICLFGGGGTAAYLHLGCETPRWLMMRRHTSAVLGTGDGCWVEVIGYYSTFITLLFMDTFIPRCTEWVNGYWVSFSCRRGMVSPQSGPSMGSRACRPCDLLDGAEGLEEDALSVFKLVAQGCIGCWSMAWPALVSSSLGPDRHCGAECSITSHLQLSVAFLHFCLRYDRTMLAAPWCFCLIFGRAKPM